METQVTVSDEASAFFQEATDELAQQESLLVKVVEESAHQLQRSVLPLVMLVLVSGIIIIRPEALLIWLIVGLLLYSYNYIILFLPTTTVRTRPKKKAQLKHEGADPRWLAIRLLLRKKKLAIEMGLTVFLGGMVPLTLSFTMILGLGLLLLVYFQLTAQPITDGLAFLLVVQISLIIFFYALMNLLRPQAQGITPLAKAWKARIGVARSTGWMATAMVATVVLGAFTGSAILFVGALILPGVTLANLFTSLGYFTLDDVLLGLLALTAQLMVMRNFQSFMSRRMASSLLRARVAKLKELLNRMEILNPGEGLGADREPEFQAIKAEYYSMMIYDIIRLDFFSLSPIYLVGPRLKYVLDERVLVQVLL
ncbi:MAG: hypothetical protein MIO90_06705 [Methanomassiliicoccales archaeon]|nr:hypothetical protein [Methanomassiliicoccales archaeon]